MKPIKSITILLLLLALMMAPACDTLEEIDLGEEPAPVFVKPVYSVDTVNGTVTDTTTNGIMWDKCANGESWSAPNCSGSPVDINYATAKAYCENNTRGGYTDWRIPTMEELSTLTYESTLYTWYDEYTTPSRWWWSSSFENNVFAYRLQLPDNNPGKADTTSPTSLQYIRCARAIQP